MIDLKFLLILLFFLSLEITILAFLLFSILNRKIYFFFKTKIASLRQRKISEKILEHVEKNLPFVPNPVFAFRAHLLTSLEAFQLRLRGDDWEALKSALAKHYLLPKARKWVRSIFWRRKNFAARVFAIAPLEQDQKSILELLHSPNFLIASIAALAAVQLELKEAVDLLLKTMSEEEGYPRYHYRDILLRGSLKVLRYVSDVASQKGDNLGVHLACLDVLSGKTVICPIPSLSQDLESQNPKIRLGALKVLIRNPLQNAAARILQFLGDPEEKIRAQAALGLESFPSPAAYATLEQCLKDPSWIVRSQAAASLKKMGQEGLSILKRQSQTIDARSYEVAHYALEFAL